MIPALVEPSPQAQVAVWASRVPGSLKVTLAWTAVETATGVVGSPVMAPVVGAALLTARLAVSVVDWPAASVAVSVRVKLPSFGQVTVVLSAVALASTQVAGVSLPAFGVTDQVVVTISPSGSPAVPAIAMGAPSTPV